MKYSWRSPTGELRRRDSRGGFFNEAKFRMLFMCDHRCPVVMIYFCQNKSAVGIDILSSHIEISLA